MRKLPNKDLVLLFKQASDMNEAFKNQHNYVHIFKLNTEWGIAVSKNFMNAFEYLLCEDEEGRDE